MGALIALILQAAASDAAAAANVADLRCLAAIASSGGAMSPGLAAAGSMYFLGRIDARSPRYDYQGEMLKLIHGGGELETDRTRCLAELRSRGGALVNLSQGLRARTGQ